MFGKRKAVINGVALLASLALLLVSVPVAKGWDGDLRTLLAAYTWSSSNTDATGYFYNSSTGMGLRGYSSGYMGLAGYGSGYGTYGNARASTGQGVRGYSSGTAGYGVYGYSSQNVGVYGRGGTSSGDYGGYFYGFEGVRGYATGSNGYGVWGTATGTYGQGAHGYASGSYGFGVYGYSPYYIGVYGRGGLSSGDYGVYGYGCTGVYGYASCSSSRGVYGYASLSNGEGVRGYTGGQGGDGVTAYATSSYGYGVDSLATGYAGHGIRATASGANAWAGIFRSATYRGLYADGASGYYDAYFPDVIYAGGTVVSALGMSFIALNEGGEVLEPGDLVALSGFMAPDGSSEPAMAVTKVNGANSGAFIGVVQSAYVKEAPAEMQPLPTVAEVAVGAAKDVDAAVFQKESAPLPQAEVVAGEDALSEEGAPLPPPTEFEQQGAIEAAPEVAPYSLTSVQQEESQVDADVGHFVEGGAEPGQYVVVVVQGIAPVKVDASAAPVKAGDALVASGSGYAQASSRARVEALGKAIPMVIGRALESFETGKGTIYVFVSVR
jgi:hypothetical protein